MENASRDYGAVRVSLQEADNYFLANAWDVDTTETMPRMNLRNTNPTRTVFVPLSFTIPMELDFHSTKLVRVNLFAIWPNDDSQENEAFYRSLWELGVDGVIAGVPVEGVASRTS